MAKKKFRPILKKIPPNIVDIIEKRKKISKQDAIVALMVKRDKAASFGDKFKELIEDLDKRIAALNK